MRNPLMLVCGGVWMMTLIGAQAVFALTAAEQLKAAPKPNFREGHTLL